MATALTSQYTRFTDKCNRVLAGGIVKTFEPNSLIPKITYQDPLATIPNLPEVILDATGRAKIYLLGEYRIQVYSSDGVLIEDNLYVDQGISQSYFQKVNKTLIAHVDSLNDLENVENVWDGRTIYVKNTGNYAFDAALDKWIKSFQDADNVKDGAESQKQINDKSVRVFESIADLLDYTPRNDGQTVFVKSYHSGWAAINPYTGPKGGGNFVYDSTKSMINDGGVCLNGWVRENTKTELNVYCFGAYGDWNATNQTGNDDTLPFQNYANYLNSNENNPRNGGARIMRVPSGSFRLDGFTINQGATYWSFHMKGEGYLTSLWFNPVGSGIVLNNENSQLTDMTMNGSLTVGVPIAGAGIPYIVTAKLSNNYTDVDLTCSGINVSFANTFAKVTGRGFTFRHGSVGSSAGAVCEIDCSPNLIFDSNGVEGAYRHFVFENNRIDNTYMIFNVTGTGAIKDHIHGIHVTDNEIKSLTDIVRSTDCTLHGVILTGNKAYGLKNIIRVPRVKGLIDSGNNWANNWMESSANNSEATAISYMYGLSNYGLDISITNTIAKGVLYAVVQTGLNNSVSSGVPGASSNIRIDNCTFDNFGNAGSNPSVINIGGTLTDSSITNNTLKTTSASLHRFVRGLSTPSDSIVIKNNVVKGSNWESQQFTYTPVLYAGGVAVPLSGSMGKYYVEDNYVVGECWVASNNLGSSSGALSLSIPTDVVVIEAASLSSVYAGFNPISMATGFPNDLSIQTRVQNNPKQIFLFKQDGSNIQVADKISTATSIGLYVKFKYRVR